MTNCLGLYENTVQLKKFGEKSKKFGDNADFSPNLCYNKGMKELDFEQYIRHTDASKKEKKLAWSTAIGLQQVDGLKPSEYLYETAKRNIEGELSFEEAKNLIDSYYRSQKSRLEDERTEEADKVSSRIAQLLSEPSFNFTPYFLLAIHNYSLLYYKILALTWDNHLVNKYLHPLILSPNEYSSFLNAISLLLHITKTVGALYLQGLTLSIFSISSLL